MARGKIWKWMDSGKPNGLTINDILGNIRMIESMVRAVLNGEMGKNIMDNGKMVNNMEEVWLFNLMVNIKKVYGIRENVSNG